MSRNRANLMRFEADLEGFAEKLGEDIGKVTRRIVADAHRRVSLRTPVDTGRARASWDVKTGSPSGWIPPENEATETAGTMGSAPQATPGKPPSEPGPKDIGDVLGKIDGTEVVFITSNLDYVQVLEGGSSQQAPAGMVMLTIAELEVEIEDIIGQLE